MNENHYKIVRPYCYSGLAILRSLHEDCYFSGINIKESQKKMVKKFIHLAFHKSAMKPRDGRPPLAVEDCKRINRKGL